MWKVSLIEFIRKVFRVRFCSLVAAATIIDVDIGIKRTSTDRNFEVVGMFDRVGYIRLDILCYYIFACDRNLFADWF